MNHFYGGDRNFARLGINMNHFYGGDKNFARLEINIIATFRVELPA